MAVSPSKTNPSLRKLKLMRVTKRENDNDNDSPSTHNLIITFANSSADVEISKNISTHEVYSAIHLRNSINLSHWTISIMASMTLTRLQKLIAQFPYLTKCSVWPIHPKASVILTFYKIGSGASTPFFQPHGCYIQQYHQANLLIYCKWQNKWQIQHTISV